MLRRGVGAGAIALLAALVMSYAATGVASAKPCAHADAVPTDRASRGEATRAILCLVNRVRAARHMRRVRTSRQLGRAASGHAEDMVARKYFAHDGPSGDDLDGRVRRSGYAARHPSFAASEALAWGEQASPRVLVRALLGSRSHRRIVLDRGARDIGLGLALGAPEGGVAPPSSTLALVFGER